VPLAQAQDPREAARSVVAFHATDPASVFLSARARVRDATVAQVERALYEDRVLLRMLGMRRTMFTVPIELVPVVQGAATRAVAADERRRLLARLQSEGLAEDVPAWLEDVMESTLRALEVRGEAVATELSADEPRLRHRILLGQGKRYEALQSISVWVLLLLAAEGRIVRARPRGSWISSQYRWAPTERWLGGPIADIATHTAQAELTRRWLRAFGPATLADLRWWTGWTMRDARRALDALDVTEVDLDGASGVALADDLEPTPDPGPWVAFLPALDATVMGWQTRDWFLGPHRAALFDTNGNAGPSVWVDGRIMGGWTQRRDGAVAYRVLEDVGREATVALATEASRLEAWMSGVRVTPRFRTPLERELTG
jgi:hypothetical protein